MYSNNRTMITRFFLFMLAMISGVSAAQAADGARPAQSAVGSSAALAVVGTKTAAALERAVYAVRPLFVEPVAFTGSEKAEILSQQIEAAPFPRIHPGDRTRQ
jgi:hypothetical protein